MKQDKTSMLVEPSKLVPWERNPRHNDGAVDKVAASIKELGFGAPIVARKGSNEIIAGHTRWKAAQKLGLEVVPVRFLDISDEKAQTMALADNKLGEIADWDNELLQEIALDLGDELMDLAGFDEPLEEFEDHAGSDDTYEKKIDPPVYEPTGEKPIAADLTDRDKTDRLLSEIETAKLPDDLKSFLKYAAERHTVFRFSKIAEYYAHAPENVQDLMEKSGLVIIDYDKAVENGFVSLSKKIGELAGQELEAQNES